MIRPGGGSSLGRGPDELFGLNLLKPSEHLHVWSQMLEQTGKGPDVPLVPDQVLSGDLSLKHQSVVFGSADPESVASDQI